LDIPDVGNFRSFCQAGEQLTLLTPLWSMGLLGVREIL
jgi:hypothetical protein